MSGDGAFFMTESSPAGVKPHEPPAGMARKPSLRGRRAGPSAGTGDGAGDGAGDGDDGEERSWVPPSKGCSAIEDETSGVWRAAPPRLPPRVDASDVVCKVADSLPFKTMQARAAWRRLFGQDACTALWTAAYWWTFLDCFPNANADVAACAEADKESLFDELAKGYFRLFVAMPQAGKRSRRKDRFLEMLPDAVAQSVFLALGAAYPNSRPAKVGDHLKARISAQVHQWMLGATAPRQPSVAHWGGQDRKVRAGSMRRIVLGGPDAGGGDAPGAGAGAGARTGQVSPPSKSKALVAVERPGMALAKREASSTALALVRAATGRTRDEAKEREALAFSADAAKRHLVHVESFTVHSTLDYSYSPLIARFLAMSGVADSRAGQQPFRMTQARQLYRAVPPSSSAVLAGSEFACAAANADGLGLSLDLIADADADDGAAAAHASASANANVNNVTAGPDGPKRQRTQGRSRARGGGASDVGAGATAAGAGNGAGSGNGAGAPKHDEDDGAESEQALVLAERALERYSNQTYKDVVESAVLTRKSLIQQHREHRKRLAQELKVLQKNAKKQQNELRTSKARAIKGDIHELSNFLVSMWKIQAT